MPTNTFAVKLVALDGVCKTMRSIFLCWLAAGMAAVAAASQPNIVLILVDDLGYYDLGCNGADLHETPHIDRFANTGVRFTTACAMSLCTPTRATLLTGKHAARLRMTTWAEKAAEGSPKDRKLLEGESFSELAHSHTTIAKYLHDAGYLTAIVGKWHLGDANHYPETHGFDVNIGGTQWGAPVTYFWPYSGMRQFPYGRQLCYVPHLEFGKPGEYLTDRLTDEALRILDRAQGRPFFLYFAHYAVHVPIEIPPDDMRHFEAKLHPGLRHRNPAYAAMLKNLDDNVGRVLEYLRQRGLDQNTIVIFAGDNGGYIGSYKGAPVTNNAPLRSGKGALYEGGIRVPLLIRWPGVTTAGAVCNEPVVLTDLFPTLLHAAGLSPAADAVDGEDLTPLLKNPAARLDRDALFFHHPHYYYPRSDGAMTPSSAIRARDWKLLEFFEDNRIELYNLSQDPGEQHDLAGQMPAQTAELRQRLHAWRESIGAALPKPNLDYKPSEQKPEKPIRKSDSKE